jgi:hypothetical protein
MTQAPITAPYSSLAPAPTDFDHQIWQRSRPIAITQLWSGAPASPSRHAEARLCRTNDALHDRFIGKQQEPLIVSDNPITDKKTLGLWNRDVCEIFIAPDSANPSRYFEFEAAPTGEWVDLGITRTPSGRETDWDFASGLTTAARLDGDRLFVGMRIPWSESIPKPAGEDVWRVNLFRCAGPESPGRYLAWRPTKTPEPNFHVHDAFGMLRFGALPA